MKRTISFIISFALWLVSSSFDLINDNPAAGPNKLALIIAIGAYDTSATGWAQISSENDVDIIKNSLVKIGFSDITVLSDAKADKKGIAEALKTLETKARAGDMIVIHLSSHGQQIADDNNDEVDGYDESIVAFGAPMNNRKYRGGSVPYDGSLHVRDEEFGSAINDIRAKVGRDGHVLVIMDSCHSGTGTRGSARVRGGADPLVPDGWKPKKDRKADDDGGFGIMSEKIKTRGAGDNLGKFVLISGASAEEVNYETEDESGKGYGSLSWCLSKAIVNLPAGSTYRYLFSKIQSEMAERAPNQKPQIEGDVDFVLFSGNYVKQEPFFLITELVSDKQIKINAGRLMGLAEGLPVTVEDNTAAKPSKDGNSLSKGKITKLGTIESTIDLETPLAIKNKVDGRVFVTAQAVPDVKVKVDLTKIKNLKLKSSMEKSIHEIAMAEISSNKPNLVFKDVVSRGARYNVDVIDSAYGSKLVDESISSGNVDSVASKCADIVQNYAQGKMFKALELKDESFNVIITRIIPIKIGSDKLRDSLDVSTLLDKGNFFNVKEETSVFLEMENLSSRKSYFNIVDIQPDGLINPLLPDRDERISPTELVLKGHEKKIIPYKIDIYPPYGNELFKVIATGAPFNLTSTIRSRGAGSRGAEENVMQKLMGDSYNKSFTRGARPDIETGEMGINTSEFSFKIIRKD